MLRHDLGNCGFGDMVFLATRNGFQIIRLDVWQYIHTCE